MGSTVSARPPAALRTSLETVQPRMAKMDLKNLEALWKVKVGHAVQRAFKLAGLSQKEVAGEIERDQAQIARWAAGTERPQFDVLFAVEPLRQPLILALAELAGESVEIETTVKLKRSA